jgi:choline-sulfatase
MHFNRPGKPGLHGFDVAMTEGEVAKAWNQGVKPKALPEGTKVKPQWRPFKDPASIWLNSEKLPFGRYYDDMRGTFIARQGVQYLQEHKDDPFALWVSFQEPHSPYDFPLEDKDRFDPARFPVPRVGPEDAWQIPIIFRNLNDEQKRGIIAAYYTSVAFLDRNIGVVLDELRRLKLENDTYVVYLPDHGYSLGQHGRFEKHCGYDPALRVPLIMRWPGRIQRGVVRDFTESIDVSATILDMLGVDPLPVQHGRSLRPYLEGKRPQQRRDHIFSQYLENEEVFIRTAERKLIFCSGKRKRTDGYEIDNPTPGRYVRLYDLKNDPGEFTDIAKKEPETVKRLEALALERYKATHPEAAQCPQGASTEEALEFFVRPRDAREG